MFFHPCFIRCVLKISAANLEIFPTKNPGTLPETNIGPENGWLEYEFPFGKAYFQGLC